MPQIWTEPRVYEYLAVAAFGGFVLWLLLLWRYGLRRATIAAILVTVFSAMLGLMAIARTNSVPQTQDYDQPWPGAMVVAGLDGLCGFVLPFGCCGSGFCSAAVVAFLVLEIGRSRREYSVVDDGGPSPDNDDV
jgi:hypothetical protein